ncbi:MAG: 3-deoxy-D-manno-octulosonic-acid transferase [Candidatus Tokpelaia sp. JSC085]|nr:MAG: 3-deoxy-D-manno-octulosonic-acid transferase [Candidatus Tokpelaia sp. JSC085]
MKNVRAALMLFVYRSIGMLIRPLIPFYLSWRAVCGKEEMNRRHERIGQPSRIRPKGPLIWLHAASVGETIALIPLLEQILSSQVNILLTTGTVTSAQLVTKHFANRLVHQYVPLDFSGVMRRFLEHWKPNLVLICESEIWPVRICELAQHHIPQILLNAKLSERSCKAWKQYAVFAHEIFSEFAVVICQSDADAERYRMLGAQNVIVAGNLKSDVVLPAHVQDLKTYRHAISQRPIWAAVSTHEGEELIASQVHTILRKRYPTLLTIIVPRHPERVSMIINKLKRKDYVCVRKSLNELPTARTDILLGDTIGEMGFYLRLTEIAFIGKSLMAEGGHNPLEPALIGAAILSGPNIGNFREIYDELMANNAVRFVFDSTMLAEHVHYLLERSDVRREMIESGRHTVAKLCGALDRTFDVLKPFLHPLILDAKRYSHGQ